MKIKSIRFKNHKILGDLFLDFTDQNGNIVDTILIAGENGTGKTTVLNEIYNLANLDLDSGTEAVVEINGIEKIFRNPEPQTNDWYKDQYRTSFYQTKMEIMNKSNKDILAIYSDVEINFKSGKVSAVTARDLDQIQVNRKAQENSASELKQLLVDIQAIDDSTLAQKVRNNIGNEIKVSDEFVEGRMGRFTRAIRYMLSDLKYKGVVNRNGYKEILFTRNGQEISIDDLSSGEKQIIYRGGFILKDINALNGALLLIDEPEISLHPKWQKKIIEFYKRIVRNESGCQTSQIFAVTHSPFIIHNNLRYRDKVIVLARVNGKIIVQDKVEYYSVGANIAVQDAFRIEMIDTRNDILYVEGRTDEIYLNKVLEVFKLEVPYEIKWIGYLDNDSHQERNTGESSMRKAIEYLRAQSKESKYAFLFDSDVQVSPKTEHNLIISKIKKRNNPKFKKGIENSLNINVLLKKKIDFSKYYSDNIIEGDYGEMKSNPKFEKMKFCEYICMLPSEELVEILANLKEELEKIKEWFEMDTMQVQIDI